MRTLVTGAGGFLGSHLVRLLARRAHTVRALVQSDEQAQIFGGAASGVEVVVGDVLDARGMREAVRGADVVYHCAAKLPGKAAEDDVWRVNVTGTENVLGGCLAGAVQRLVFVSTDSVYGDRHNPGATEETPLNPDYVFEGNYPRAKVAGERLVLRCQQDHGLPVSIIRPCLMYGPGSSSGTDIMRGWAARDLHLLIDAGRAKISLAYVEDVAEAMVLAAAAPQAVGQCYNVSDGVPYTRRAILEALAEATGRTKRFLSVPSGPMLGVGWLLRPVLGKIHPGLAHRLNPRELRFTIDDHVIAIRKAQEELGYQPKVFLREGVARTVAWLAGQESAPVRSDASVPA